MRSAATQPYRTRHRRSILPLAALLLGSLLAAADGALAEEDSDAQRANRERCTNGALIGGVAGAVLPRRGWRNRVGGAALGATAGCVLNRGVNEGR